MKRSSSEDETMVGTETIKEIVRYKRCKLRAGCSGTDHENFEVHILAIGVKRGSRLVFGKEEVSL